MLFICNAKCPELDKDKAKKCCNEISSPEELKALRMRDCPIDKERSTNFLQAITS